MDNAEFFQHVVSFLEKRVEMIDSRSNTFLAVAIGLLVAYGYVTKEFFYNSSGYVFLGVHSILTLSSCLLFLQAIRPSRYFFWGSAAPRDQIECERYMFWPEHNPSLEEMLKNEKDFTKCFQSFTKQDILDNYQRAVNAELKIVVSKYNFYRKAVILFKFLIAFDIIDLLVLLVTQKIL